MSTRLAIVYLAGLISFGAAAGTDFQHSELTESQVRQASEWKLSKDEYRRFQDVVNGSRSYFTPNLDKNPLLALGLEARTPEERAHYADLWVKLQYEKNLNTLLWVLEVETAWERNFPGVPSFAYGDSPYATWAAGNVHNGQKSTFFTKKSPLMSDVQLQPNTLRIKLYVSTSSCSDCIAEYTKAKGQLDRKDVSGIDIFFVNETDHRKIAQWAMNAKIDPQVVSKKLITLNPYSESVSKIPFVEYE